MSRLIIGRGRVLLKAFRSRNVIILSISQALGSSGASMVVFAGGILGADLAPTPALATLPISSLIVGTALSTIPAALLMRRIGRKNGYRVGALVGLLAALLAAFATSRSDFALFCLATLAIGASIAFVQQYRFGAAESVTPEHSGQAVSLVLLGGIAAGIIGPQVARSTVDLLPAGPFSGSFVVLAGLFVLALILLTFLGEIIVADDGGVTRERPLLEVAVQPAYIAALMAGVVSYGVMSFIMTATPLEMHTMHGFTLGETAWVIQSHIIAMYLPALFSGVLIDRLGLERMMLLGVGCLLACVGLGIASEALLEYWGALVLLGLGWNFLYVGGTVLLTRSYHPAERFKAQALNDFTIFGIQAFTSLSAGTVLFRANWDTLMLLNLPALALMLLVILTTRRQLNRGAADESLPL